MAYRVTDFSSLIVMSFARQKSSWAVVDSVELTRTFSIVSRKRRWITYLTREHNSKVSSSITVGREVLCGRVCVPELAIRKAD